MQMNYSSYFGTSASKAKNQAEELPAVTPGTAPEAMSFSNGSRDLELLDNFKDIRSRIKAVAFDIDGTLTDSIDQIVACTHYTFDNLKIPRLDDETVKSMIGMELDEGLKKILPGDFRHLKDQITDVYKRTYSEHAEIHQFKTFEGVEELLSAIKQSGLKIGYASGKSSLAMERTLHNTVMGSYCDAYCAGDEVPSKPHTMMMEVLASRLGVRPEEILGIGDAGMDIEMYKNAGAFSCAVQSGVWSGEALLALGPDLMAKRATDLIHLF